ncbi:MAG: AAA family ATPase, partial [Planctomycetaceae bacterium]|nr:AAA family ATPase [Planctomycetaceae bacterium]
RDLKPANIIMVEGIKPVIVDFGLAVSDSQRASGTSLGEISGTPAFMSPEQASGAGHRIDGRTDIYSLGVILYRIITGRLPFESKNTLELLRQVRDDEPQPPRQLVRSLNRELERICLKAMAKSLRHRYTTADDLADDLRKLLREDGLDQHSLMTISLSNQPPVADRSMRPSLSTGRSTQSAEPAEMSEADRLETTGNGPEQSSTGESTATYIPQADGQNDFDDAVRRAVEVTSPNAGQHSDGEALEIEDHSSSSLPSSVKRFLEAQRRHVTVMNCGCDVFENPDLQEFLDPEELNEILREFQQRCRSLAVEFRGSVIQETDDGLAVCFGFPHSLEDSGQQAVRFGLKVISSAGDIQVRTTEGTFRPAARVVAHSDVAVVEMRSSEDDSGSSTVSVVGQVRNVASRLENIAETGVMLITDQTFRLVKRSFECESLGVQRVRGVSGGMQVYRVVAERWLGGDDQLNAAMDTTPLIGRDQEIGLLMDRWEQATEGMGQVVLLIGEAGLGKSRLVHALRRHVQAELAGETDSIIEWRSGSQHQSSSLYPVIDFLRRRLGVETHEDGPSRLSKLVAWLRELHLDGDTEIALLASLLSIPLPEQYSVPDLPPQRQKEELFGLLTDVLREQSRVKPVLFIIEDLHWVDPTTLEFLEGFVEQGLHDSILTLMTFRPEFETPWRSRAHQTNLALNRLTSRQIREMIESRAGRSVSEQIVSQVIERTDGVPLFIEEFTQMILESSEGSDDGEDSSSATISGHIVPATLQDMLMSRLDRMASRIEVVQQAAAIGRVFSWEVIHAASELPESDLREELEKLVQAELLFARGRAPRIEYSFKHALIQDAAYNSLIRATRQDFHRRIGDAIETRLPETVEQQPELLGLHFSEAGEHSKAIDYWEKAGTRSLARRAHREAIQQFRSALELLPLLDDNEQRWRTEIRLLTSIGV